MNQILDEKKGRELKNEGIKQALETAEKKDENWGAKAYNFLCEYIKENKEFKAEEVRMASLGHVPIPPSKRAWGSVIVMAKKNNLIIRKGYASVKNPRAHQAICTVWKVAS